MGGALRSYGLNEYSVTFTGTVEGTSISHVDGGTHVFAGKVNLDAFYASAGVTSFVGNANVGTIYSSGGSVVIGNGSDASLAVVSRVETGDSAWGGSMSLKIESGSTLKITGDNNGSSYKAASLLLGEWAQSTQLEVSGALLARNAKALVGDNNMTITVADGGVLALKGIGIADTSKTVSVQGIALNINEGGKMLLGDGGISSSKTWSGTVGAGVIGTYSDSGTTISNDLELTSTTGTTFDTQKYIFADDGNSIFRGIDAGSISMAGVLSGMGKLIKDGAGTLTLSNANTYSGGTTISSGKLVAANASALGTSTVTISGGQLEISGTDVTVSNNITVVVGDSLASAVILGDGSLSGTITLDYVASAEDAALMIATETTTKTYTLLSGNVGANLTEADFAVGSGWADGWNVTDYVYDSETGIGTLTLTIPEPSAFGLLAGVGALALVVARRKRRK